MGGSVSASRVGSSRPRETSRGWTGRAELEIVASRLQDAAVAAVTRIWPVRVAHASRCRGERANSDSSPSRPGKQAPRSRRSRRPGARRRSASVALPDHAVAVEDARSALDAERPARRRGTAEPGRRPAACLPARSRCPSSGRAPRAASPTSSRSRSSACRGGPGTAARRRLGRRGRADAPAPGHDLIDAAQRAVVEVAGEDRLEPDALAVDAGVDLGHSDAGETENTTSIAASRMKSQSSSLRRNSSWGIAARTAGTSRSSSTRSRSVAATSGRPPQGGQQARVEDDRVVAKRPHPTRHRADRRFA